MSSKTIPYSKIIRTFDAYLGVLCTDIRPQDEQEIMKKQPTVISNGIKKEGNILQMLTVGTVFTGIGAFEKALQQLEIEHEIKFACDNGERELSLPIKVIKELISHWSENEKKTFWEKHYFEAGKPNSDRTKIVLNVDLTNDLMEVAPKSITKGLQNICNKGNSYTFKYSQLKALASSLSEEDRKAFLDAFNSINGRPRTADSRYEITYDDIVALTPEQDIKQREHFVNHLYELTGKENYVKKSYFANYAITEENWHEDIRFLDGNEYANKVDIMVGGSPCQSFSTYGKKRGLEDTRGTLFYDYARIISECKPKVFIYENVKNVLNNDNGRTWKVMKEVWTSLNYDLHFTTLNAADYGTPQLRQRLFLIGFRKDLKAKNYKFPEPYELTTKSTDYLEPSVDKKYYLGKKGFEWVTSPEKNLRRSRVNQDIIGCETANQQDNWIGDFRVEPVQSWQRKDPDIYIGSYKGKESVARKMTPTECLRLMGFKSFNQIVDDKVMYRQAGNSIVVSVLESLIESIIPYLNK